MREYRQALNERNGFDIGSAGWRAAQLKLEQVVERYLQSADRRMAMEIMDEVYSLNDCGAEYDDEIVQKDISLLMDNGFEEYAEELRELDWK